jgi:hypothetical protein
MKPFRNYPATLSRLLQGILCLVISIIIESYFPKDYILEPEFMGENIAMKLLYNCAAL